MPQVGGGSKTVEYFKDKNGLIIPLPVENGKLVDGSDAPMDPLRAKVKQRSALVKYAKLTSARRIDLIVAASTESEKILVLAEQGSLTKELLFK